MDHSLKNHYHKRLLFFMVGMVLFVAPFALSLTALGFLIPIISVNAGNAAAHSLPSIHRAMCLRMPLIWAVWQRETLVFRIIGNPLYALVFVLIVISIFLGPLFCGWLCPGAITEHLSRLVPEKLKIDLKHAIDPAPLRYGFLAGYFIVAAPLVNKSVCCSFCNWTWIEDILSALFGKTDGVTGGTMFAYSSSSIITFLLTFGFLGIFMKGGRGWCNFMCPAGALQNLAHWLGSKFKFTYKLLLVKEKCNDCFKCVDACPTWAILPSQNSVNINRHICNGCGDCVLSCPTSALIYSRRLPREN